MAKATESALGDLHAAVADALTEVVRDGQTVVDKEGNAIKLPASAAHLGAAIAFLKNNNITADPDTNEGLANLKDALARRRQKGRTSSSAFAEASEAFAAANGDLLQ